MTAGRYDTYFQDLFPHQLTPTTSASACHTNYGMHPFARTHKAEMLSVTKIAVWGGCELKKNKKKRSRLKQINVKIAVVPRQGNLRR